MMLCRISKLTFGEGTRLRIHYCTVSGEEIEAQCQWQSTILTATIVMQRVWDTM